METFFFYEQARDGVSIGVSVLQRGCAEALGGLAGLRAAERLGGQATAAPMMLQEERRGR